MDQLKLDEAYQLIEQYLQHDYPLAGVHRNQLLMDKATIDCLYGHYQPLTDKKLLKFMKAARTNPSVLRSEYAIASAKNDRDRMQQLVDEMEELKKNYPYPNDLQADLELMKMICEKTQN